MIFPTLLNQKMIHEVYSARRIAPKTMPIVTKNIAARTDFLFIDYSFFCY